MNTQAPTRRTIADYPGYRIAAPLGSEVIHDADNEIDMPIIRHGQTYALPFKHRRTGETLWHMFRAGTVIDYAREYHEDPVNAVLNAMEKGHNLRWMNACPVSITNGGHGPKPEHIGLEWGQVVFFDGRRFTLKKAPNDNVALVPAY